LEFTLSCQEKLSSVLKGFGFVGSASFKSSIQPDWATWPPR
jgi:hypothetical protein